MFGKQRNILLMAVFAAMLLLLLGCSGNAAAPEPSGETNTTPQQPQQPQQPPSGNEPPADTSFELTYENWDRIVEEAKKEGRVVVAGPPVPANRETILQFEKAYPDIKVELTSTNPAEFEPRLISERSANKFLWDVYLTGTTASLFTRQIPDGLYDPIKPVIIDPDVLDDGNWLAGFEGGFMDQGNEYVYAFGADQVATIQINSDMIGEGEFNGIEDLLDPKWKGKIAMYDPRQRGFINIIFAQLMDRLGEEGVKKLLTEQNPVFASSPAQLGEWAVRGSYPIIIGMGIPERNRFAAEGLGKNLKAVPGTEIVTNGWANVLLVNKAPNPHAATVFINWLLSKEAQQDWVERSNLNSRRLDVPAGNPEHHVEEGQMWLDGRLYNTEQGAGKTEIGVQLANEALK